jgi:hypothetical protein
LIGNPLLTAICLLFVAKKSNKKLMKTKTKNGLLPITLSNQQAL